MIAKKEYKGCLDCQEALTEFLHKAVKKNLNLSGEAWEDMVRRMARHPIVKQVVGYSNE